MALDEKDALTGITSPPYDKGVLNETRKKGHPLFWRETLDVECLITLFKDLHAACIFDLCAGSGAAACAAAVLDIPYEGIAMNAKHATWLNSILDKAIFCIVQLRSIPTDAKGKPDEEAKKLQENVAEYFKTLVEEGRQYVIRSIDDDEEDDDGVETEASGENDV